MGICLPSVMGGVLVEEGVAVDVRVGRGGGIRADGCG